MKKETYPLSVALVPGRIEKRLAERVKYKLSETSEWFYFQTRCLTNEVRMNEYFLNEDFSQQIAIPDGVQVKQLTPSGSVIIQDYSLPDYNTEYVLEHDGVAVFYWEKAIVLDFLLEQSTTISDNRVTIQMSEKFNNDDEEDDSIPSLL